MSFKMMPKWGHWFWITAILLQFSAPIPVLSIGRGGFERDLNTGVSLTDPLPFPVFAGPHIAQGPLTIVTPSTVVRYHGVEASTQTDRQSAGFARRLDDELPALAKAIHQSGSVDTTNQADPGDVSVSKSVSVVSVKYSLSGERRRQTQTQSQTLEEEPTIQNPQTSKDPSTTTTTTTNAPTTTTSKTTTTTPLPVRVDSPTTTTLFTTTTTTQATTTTTRTTTTTTSTTTTSASTTTSQSTETNNAKQKVTQAAEEDPESPGVEGSSPKNEELYISEVASSSVGREDKSLFASTENVRFVQHTQVQSTTRTSTASTSTSTTSTYRPSPRLFPIESVQNSFPVTQSNSSTEKSTTTTSTTIDFLATPTRVFLQEVEVVSEADSDKDFPASDTQVPDQGDKNLATNSSDSNGKMIVEYLEDAELARSFPSTKWNVYEDKDGTWYLQKYPKKEGVSTESKSDTEYEELPKVVDVAEGAGLSLFDGGDSDRDEEPYEKFMAEESGRSTPDVASTNEEYTDTSSDDDLLPAYDERHFEEEIAEPRMLSTAQKPSSSGIARDHLREADGQPQRRKPMTIDVTTVVGITVGAFLFILIGTVGLGAFIYHEKYMNKPQTLEDRYSSTDSDGSSVDDPYRRITHIDCVGFDTTRDTFCEEMYNLDNDSFLNSLETVNAPSSYWIHDSSRHSDSDV